MLIFGSWRALECLKPQKSPNGEVLQRFFYTATQGLGVPCKPRVRKLKNKGRDLTLQISDYVILMSLDTFLILFSSYHSYFCSCRPSKKVVQMWKSWVCFNFFKFSKNSPLKNQEKNFFYFKKIFFHFLDFFTSL